MGTSDSYGGAGGGTPLIPTWLDDDVATSAPGVAPSGGGEGTPESAEDGGDPPPRTIPQPGDADRYRSARSNFSRFVRSDGTDRRSLGRAISTYVSRSAGGAPRAARRMGASRIAGAGLVRFLNDAATQGVREALRILNLEGLAGRPVEEIFAGLADYICPEGGSIDEGIARGAFIETIADLTEAGITDLDGLTGAQVQTVFELYATHAIEARLCNDIGARVVTLPADPRVAELVQSQLRDFIHRGVSDALNASGVSIQSLMPETVLDFVTDIYRAAFEILETLGEEETPE